MYMYIYIIKYLNYEPIFSILSLHHHPAAPAMFFKPNSAFFCVHKNSIILKTFTHQKFENRFLCFRSNGLMLACWYTQWQTKAVLSTPRKCWVLWSERHLMAAAQPMALVERLHLCPLLCWATKPTWTIWDRSVTLQLPARGVKKLFSRYEITYDV